MKPLRSTLVVLAFVACPVLAADMSVTQKNQTFSVPSMAIHIGDTIHFDNLDTVTHNITIKGGGDEDTDDLGLQKPGVEVSHRFDATGSFRIVCSIHPRMRMTVTVK